MGRQSDISNCFGEIPHSGLMSAIEERISDRNLLKLLRAMLRAGVMEDGAVHREDAGTPRAGSSRPACCATSTCTGSTGSGPSAGLGSWSVSRMTCWCSATTDGRPRTLSRRFRLILAEMGLQLEPAKTRIVRLKESGEGLDFLGFHRRRVRERGYEHLVLARWPSREAMSEPATGSVSSRSANGHCCRSKRSSRTSTTSCAAGRTTTAMGTVALLSPRSEPTRCSAWFCSWLTGTTAQRGVGGGREPPLPQPARTDQPRPTRRHP